VNPQTGKFNTNSRSYRFKRYRVSTSQLEKLGVLHAIKKAGGLLHILQKYIPDHCWDQKLISEKFTKKSQQKQLFDMVRKIFADKDVFEEYYHPGIRFSTSRRKVQLDVFIPSLSLAFEFQGEYHYHDHDVFGKLAHQKRRDEEKRVACERVNITLIEIPYWWNQSKDFILTELGKRRPDINLT